MDFKVIKNQTQLKKLAQNKFCFIYNREAVGNSWIEVSKGVLIKTYIEQTNEPEGFVVAGSSDSCLFVKLKNRNDDFIQEFQ